MCQPETTSSIGTGSSPRVYPRPPYPSIQNVVLLTIHFWVELAALGTATMHLFFPIYQCAYSVVQETWQFDDRVFFAIAMATVHTGTFLLFNVPHFIMDTFQIGQSFKLYRKPYMLPKRQQLTRLLLELSVSHLLVAPTTLYLLEPLFRWSMTIPNAPLPPSTTIALTFPIMSEVNGILFYCGHRLLHSKFLYKTIHKKHHEFSGTVGYAAEYAHPLEAALGNQFPIAAGILLLRPVHPLVLMVWIFLGLRETYTNHSGYCFLRPDTCSPYRVVRFLSREEQTAHHDFHHTCNQGNFGGPIWMDWVFGTMDHYQSMGGCHGYLSLKKREENKLE